MAIPTYDQFIEPLLRHLAQHDVGVSSTQVCAALADHVGLSDAERLERLPSGRQPVHHNRIGWAHDRLKRAGLSASERRGVWRLTDAGRAFVREHPAPLTDDQIERIAHVSRSSRLLDGPELPTQSEPSVPASSAVVTTSTSTPGERIDEALAELSESVADELLELIANGSPSFFEGLVLDLLHAMGYGTNRSDLVRVGGTGDGGIDGIISLDRLGLEKVYVQAKRWQSNVGRPDIQGFFGALAGRRAHKGVFITTSGFTREAREFAASVSDHLVLVDGEHLAELMIEYGVGVSCRSIKVPEVDSDYFE